MPRISTTFIDFSGSTNIYQPMVKEEAFWRQELQDIKASGMETIIISRAMDNGRTHYPSAHFENWDNQDRIGMIMDLSQEFDLKVMIGLYLNLQLWDKSRDFAQMMHRDLNINTRLFDEIIERFGDHPQLAGIYIPDEADRDNAATPERRQIFQNFFGALYAHISTCTKQPFLVSPFFSKTLPPEELAAWWDTFLDRPMFSILAMQDGVGCLRGLQPADISTYYAPLQKVLSKHQIAFWNNVETFAHLPVEEQYWTFIPAPLDRIDQQYVAGRAFVENTITWEFGHFLSRQQINPSRYEEFKEWNLR